MFVGRPPALATLREVVGSIWEECFFFAAEIATGTSQNACRWRGPVVPNSDNSEVQTSIELSSERTGAGLSISSVAGSRGDGWWHRRLVHRPCLRIDGFMNVEDEPPSWCGHNHGLWLRHVVASLGARAFSDPPPPSQSAPLPLAHPARQRHCSWCLPRALLFSNLVLPRWRSPW